MEEKTKRVGDRAVQEEVLKTPTGTRYLFGRFWNLQDY